MTEPETLVSLSNQCHKNKYINKIAMCGTCFHSDLNKPGNQRLDNIKELLTLLRVTMAQSEFYILKKLKSYTSLEIQIKK